MLELSEVHRTKGIGFGNHRNEIDTRTQAFHNFNVQRFESVSCWSDEIQASMYTKVEFVMAARLLLLKHVRLMLIVEELDDRLPGVVVVHVVAKAGRIDHSKADCTGQLRSG